MVWAGIGLVWLSCSPAFGQEMNGLYEQGRRFYEQGDYPKAIDLLEKSIKLDGNFAPAYNQLGLAYKDSNANPSEVVWYFKTAIQIDPNYLEAYDNLGKAYYGMGEFDKAEEAFKKALAINPDYGGVQFSLAWVYLLGKSRPHDAIFYFKKVLERTKLPYAYFGLGLAYFMVDERPLVLDMITSLREAKEDKLAEQLENMVRDYYYVPGETGGSLVNIPPPPEIIREIPSQPKANPQQPAEQEPAGFTTKVRMKGTMYSVSEAEQKQKQSTVTVRPTSSQAGLIPAPQVQSNTAPEKSAAKKTGSPTIEIRGSLSP